MGKDHTPGGFYRPSGYKSDLEIAESAPTTRSVNTSFGSQNHNAYIMNTDHTHEHFYYDPATQKSGWHGSNYETRNNHPNLQGQPDVKTKEGTETEKENRFLEGLKVDQATIDRCNDVSRTAAQSAQTQSAKSMADDGGRERGESGPGSLGRESGNKSGEGSGHEGTSGHGTSGQGAEGQGGGGHGSDGQGGGGHGGSGGGH